MQAKIIAYFKPRPPSQTLNHPQHHLVDPPHISVAIKGSADPKEPSYFNNGIASQQIEEAKECVGLKNCPSKSTSLSTRTLNKKRSYAQLHLELGQSNFLLQTCSICGFKYACGDDGDEKVHKEFHMDYTQGIQFKGWHNERVILVSSTEAGRIILVLDSDPPAHKKKVQKVVEMMEMEFGSGWLVHKLCKMYLFISQRRIAGCLIAEPIKNAFRVIQNSVCLRNLDGVHAKKTTNNIVLQFGDICFHREALERAPSANTHEAVEDDPMGAMFLENEAVPAVCGIRAIWVSPAMRRKHIASKLLDAARMSFCDDFELKPSQLAFSDPTSAGKALASRYSGTASFLAYKPDV